MNLIVLFFLTWLSESDPVKWSVRYKSTSKLDDKVIITAKIEKDWYIYGPKLKVEGPMPLQVKAISGADLIGEVLGLNLKSKHDEIWGGEISYFEKTGSLEQSVRNSQKLITISLKGQVCNNTTGTCIPINKEITLNTSL